MGIGPSYSRPGDSFAVILGGGVPYLLRADTEAWVYVGEACLHFLMSGEIVEGEVECEISDLR